MAQLLLVNSRWLASDRSAYLEKLFPKTSLVGTFLGLLTRILPGGLYLFLTYRTLTNVSDR